MSDQQLRLVRIFIEGRVQGVGYRAFLVREASLLALDGWARNRRDGRVEAVVSGPRVAVDALVAAARRGPIHARVDILHVEDIDTAALQEGGATTGFCVAPTV